MKKTLVALLLFTGAAFPYVAGYQVEPVKALWSGWALGDVNHGVAQSVVACWDSLERIELFAGAKGNGGAYTATVFDGNTQLMTSDGSQDDDCRWVRFENWNTQVAFTKGKTLTIRFTRGGTDSLEYYYDSTDKYKYGWMTVGSIAHGYWDLAMRCYGRMNPVSDVWRACVNDADDPPGGGAVTALVKAESMGVKWIREDFMGWDGWDWKRDSVMQIYHLYLDSGFSMVGILCYGRAVDSVSSRGDKPGNPQDFVPRHLWAEEGQTNYWAEYCHSIMDSLDSVRYWEIWPEANTPWGPRDPDTAYYGSPDDSIDTWRERCSLYVRLCYIAESIADTLGGGRKVLGGAPYRLLDDDGGSVMPGVDWLWNVFDLAEHRYGGVENCFDIASVHPYMHFSPGLYFCDSTFHTNLDTARWVMRQAGYPGMELWATEYGWPRWNKTSETLPPSPVTDSLMQARNICQFYTSSIARQADPRGGYDRAIHYELTSYRVSGDNNGFGFLDSLSDQPRMPHSWAFEQLGMLTGKRFNGRVMTGDTVTDTLVRMYEFEDPVSAKKTWVCWRNQLATDGNNEPPSVAIQLPARTDGIDWQYTAYGPGDPSYTDTAATDGWYGLTISTRPRFISEPSADSTSRPDVKVDSIRLVPALPQIGRPLAAHVYFRNVGNAPTPLADPPTPAPYLTWVVLRHNGDSVTQAWYLRELHDGDADSVSIYVSSVPDSWRGSALFDATVNYEQKYVERDGMDDNDGYSRNTVVWSPVGDLIGVFDGSHSNAPLPLFKLESHAMEVDTSGQTGCDSARLVQWWYGLNDTIVHGGDTTAWFCINQATTFDTTWRYLSGQGKYKLFVQLKDSWSMSDLIPDTTHPFVVFDTAGPSGSIVINAGARFAPRATCTLRLAACDSASGVYGMRFSNRALVNLVRNGTFAATDGSWSFTNGGYDSSLQMAVFSVSPSAESRARQFVPVESISAHYGDSCVLEASILAHMHGGDASGDVSFSYYSTKQDTSLHDTLWSLVDSASYSGDLLSLTGRYNLSTRFLLTPPAADSGWVWRGGMVKVRAQGVGSGTGSVWCDNAALNLYQPQSGYAWWGMYDTMAAWSMGGAAGQHIIRALYIDSAGTENEVAFADTVILDTMPPLVHISLPQLGQYVSGVVEVTGWAYDSIEVASDTWFASRRLSYRHQDSTNWLPVTPDSVSYSPAYPNENPLFGPAVHLGYWNTGSLPIGNYYVKASDDDSAGHSSSHTIWVVVSNGGMGGNSCGGPEGGGTGMGEGSLYVGSADGAVLHLSDALDSLDAFSVCDSGSEANVTAILEVGNDSLLVLDAHNKRIHKLHRNGQNRRRLVSNLSQPMDLKRDANGNFYLVDRGLHRIGKFRRDGTLVFTRGGPGQDSTNLNSPEAIAVKGSLVYVADAKNDRIAVWDTSGDYQGSIKGDFANPTAVMVTDSGAIYLTDGSDGEIKGITPLGGNIVAGTVSGGSKLRGLVLSENGHSVFTLAPQPNTVYKLRILSDDSIPGGVQSQRNLNLPKILSLAQPFPNPARTRLSISYALPRQTRVSVKLYDIMGKLVTTLASGDQKPGYYHVTWNRQDAKGRSCACGVYFCTLSAENKRFSRKVVLTE